MPNTSSRIKQTEEFVKKSFINKPHFSFNDWTVMYNHSLLVRDLALEIANELDCNREVLSISALLHDIGKTQDADEETLHTNHAYFNLQISQDFIDSLNLSKKNMEKVKSIISYTSNSIEMDIIKDADAIALYKDKRLYMLFVQWANEKKLDWAIKRKLAKFNNLNFDISRIIAKPLFDQMKKEWEMYLEKSL